MKLYNTLTQDIEHFNPTDERLVKMYVCGITPYDTTHLGHAFTYMTFDVLQRYLRHIGYDVTYVQNVTDIDDDILKRAKAVKKDWKELGAYWTDRFLTDFKQLNMILPQQYVKATETIPTIITMIVSLQEKGFAYERDGNVYFNVRKDSEYGKLAKYSEKEMIQLSKERGADPDDKRKYHPLDFILWQKSLAGEPNWESPWGNGRPGWHIECSAMIYKYLGKYIDIHGGGSDLIYPHHESEIAQSENFTGKKPFSKFWIHTGAVGYKGEKMSKSLGNLVMISDLLNTYNPNTIRFLLLSHHYRKPWEFKDSMLKEADEQAAVLTNIKMTTSDKKLSRSLLQEFEKCLADDLDTPQALRILKETIKQKNYPTAKKMSTILGFTT